MPGRNVAIDGPASSGKGTVARRVALKLGCTYVDTGAMYRVVALWALEQGVPLTEGSRLAQGIPGLALRFDTRPESYGVWMGERDVTEAIRAPAVGNAASKVSGHAEVREALVRQQRELASRERVVMDGRDIGTVVLPDSSFKIYLDASLQERAQRRFDDERARGGNPSLLQVQADLAERDRRDMERAVSPLMVAEGAWHLDTTELSIDEVVRQICARVEVNEAEHDQQ